MKAKFYSGTRNASSWALRAWLALREAEVPFDERIVDIRRPQRFANLAAVSELSPAGTVPLLQVGGEVIFDSVAIMEFANEASGGALLPKDPVSRARARSIVAWQHAGLSGICSRISFESAFYPWKRALTSEEQSEAQRLFDELERTLTSSGGPYLFGAISLADLALAPTVVRLTRHDLGLAHHPKSKAWSQRLLAGPHLSEWLAEADRLEPIWDDRYLAAPPEQTRWRTTLDAPMTRVGAGQTEAVA